MIVENNSSIFHKNNPSQIFNYTMLSTRNHMNKSENYTQSSDSEILNENDILKKLNQKHLIKK